MKTVEYTIWRDENFFLGFCNLYPEYLSQGVTKLEVLENLRSLLEDIETLDIPFISKEQGCRAG